jgi:hypothetical protein
MASRFGRTEEDTEVKKAVDDTQEYFNTQDKREWVEWAGKMLIPCLHTQMAMEKVDAERVEQDMVDEMR